MPDCFPYLMANETMHSKWQYVRRSLTPETEKTLGTGGFPPMYDLSSENIRCGRNSTSTGAQSDVATIEAGSKVGFRPDLYPKSWCVGCGQPQQPYFHDGPLFAYLAKSPQQTKEGLQTWDGNGDFFKIAQRGPYNDSWWWWDVISNNKTLFSEWNFTIPRATPPGFYLLRMDSIFPKPEFNRTQFYASCAQVEIVGSEDGGAQPGPTVRFPGAFDNYDPGVLLPAELWPGKNLTKYKMPGPPVWTGREG
ncbi:glycoside hydrolase [Clohesyomyces aquaticus]|uniref:lytic cellulose monooxygenase (C4-dehydrogenating) n=1 Tax=Clohesyomyces aquaticus TaxID=1231657 RepID=A0A1Y1YQB3_9PLEO|nr:glycoside hydrolase [Clohesyomyces aquaticus]